MQTDARDDESIIDYGSPDDASQAGDTAKAPAVADEVLPDTLYLIPVPQRPFFPGQVQPVAINPEEWAGTLKSVAESGQGRGRVLSYVDPQQFRRRSAEPRHFPEMGASCACTDRR
jgi:ATP-dependent Lon protease